MEAVQNAINRTVQTMHPSPSTQTFSDNSQSESESKNPTPVREVYKCFMCRDMGWLYGVDHKGEVIWNNGHPPIVRCKCQTGQDSERRRRYLLRIDGLNPSERQKRFDDLVRHEYNGAAIRLVESCLEWRRGIVTLTGGPGTGKSTLLMCAVNQARESNVTAVYTTVTDLLDYLRQAYAPNTDLNFDARWDTLIRCEVLALDELDEFNTTPWAMERFLRLIDERWRAMDRCLTLCATNARLNSLPEKVASRLRDGRAHVAEMKGVDMRQYQSW